MAELKPDCAGSGRIVGKSPDGRKPCPECGRSVKLVGVFDYPWSGAKAKVPRHLASPASAVPRGVSGVGHQTFPPAGTADSKDQR